MNVCLASDHAGFELKEHLKKVLKERGYTVSDFGAHEFDPADDYPDFIYPAALAVANDPDSRGIVFGFSGQGEAMVANKVPGIRAIIYYGKTRGPKDIIELSRVHNNANVLAIGAGFVSLEEAGEVAIRWLETPYPGEERHARRLEKIVEIEKRRMASNFKSSV